MLIRHHIRLDKDKSFSCDTFETLKNMFPRHLLCKQPDGVRGWVIARWHLLHFKFLMPKSQSFGESRGTIIYFLDLGRRALCRRELDYRPRAAVVDVARKAGSAYLEERSGELPAPKDARLIRFDRPLCKFPPQIDRYSGLSYGNTCFLLRTERFFLPADSEPRIWRVYGGELRHDLPSLNLPCKAFRWLDNPTKCHDSFILHSDAIHLRNRLFIFKIRWLASKDACSETQLKIARG